MCSRQRGITLVEVIMFMVIVGTAMAAVMMVFSGTSRNSATPLIRKQALAVAESLMEEVRLKPFTYCDPDDPAVTTAANAAACAIPEVPGPEAGESRTSAVTPFDNVNDYNGFGMAGGIVDLTGAAIPNLTNYTATVAVAPVVFGGLAAAESLRVTVTVTFPPNITIRLDGIRTRYAPNEP